MSTSIHNMNKIVFVEDDAEVGALIAAYLGKHDMDVVLKERRRLVLLARETPLNLGHIRNMAAVTEMGGIIFPPVPALYQRPQTADDIVTHSVNRALDLFDLQVNNIPRWGEGELRFN